MRIIKRTEGSASILCLYGRVDIGTRAMLEAEFEKVGQEPGSQVVLNVEGVTFIDHTGLGWLVVTHERFGRVQCRMSLVRPPELLRSMLDRAGISRLIPVYESEAAVLADMAAAG